ncbi:hypothetical protein [Saccharothrix longispora]|uniref:hypothetical protein n=1 Tax=Saccharothrix longispora TaxID=33920 RepID=UPI0028FD30A3|nr:hypothetical protein [Saccharothrix longispora]MDU0291599.1 hypothetical protein [Saccharothrix longispora]
MAVVHAEQGQRARVGQVHALGRGGREQRQVVGVVGVVDGVGVGQRGPRGRVVDEGPE